MASQEHGRTFYRIVWTNPPTIADFIPKRSKPGWMEDPEVARLRSGISVYQTEAQARRKSRGMPWLGNAFIAELQIADQADIRYERTTRSHGHFTLWGSPDIILASVVRVTPSRDAREIESNL